MNNNKTVAWIRLFVAVIIGIAPVELVCYYWFNVALADLIFFTGALFIIGWGYLVDVATDDPAVLERIKSGK